MICINKIDLVEPANLQPLVGVYSQMGYDVLLVSAKTGFGIERLRQLVAGRASVVAGQSGVGKSSLLNAIDPALHLRVRRGQRGQREGQAHDDHRPAAAAGRRRLRGRYAGHPAVSALGRDSRGGGRLLPRPAALRQPVPLSRLHAHARRRLRRQGRRGRRPAGRAALRKLLPLVCGQMDDLIGPVGATVPQ